jgi:hypothetical protein
MTTDEQRAYALDALARQISNGRSANFESLAPAQQKQAEARVEELTPAQLRQLDEVRKARETTTTAAATQANLKKYGAELVKLPTKSARIRYLHDQGVPKGDIRRMLGITFQHARAVVHAYELRKAEDALLAQQQQAQQNGAEQMQEAEQTDETEQQEQDRDTVPASAEFYDDGARQPGEEF